MGGGEKKSEVQCTHVDPWAGHATRSYPHIEGSRGMHGGMGGSLTSLYVGVPALTDMASRGVPPDPQTMFSRQQAELQYYMSWGGGGLNFIRNNFIRECKKY